MKHQYVNKITQESDVITELIKQFERIAFDVKISIFVLKKACSKRFAKATFVPQSQQKEGESLKLQLEAIIISRNSTKTCGSNVHLFK